MFITYYKKNEKLYAALCESKRDGKKVNKTMTSLGRVIDKDKGIFKSRERGYFTYSLATQTYGKVDPAFSVPTTRGKLKLLQDFGDTFFLDKFMEKEKILDCINAIGYGNNDTLKALICYYIVSNSANYHAKDWYDFNYASILYPNANLISQRISECLEAIGDEYSYRSFFNSYIKLFENVAKETNAAIDSTGLPNSIHFPLTAISNHNGEINNEVRLIYVLHLKTSLPIYFRYCPGNVIDASTLVRTLAELKAMNVNVKFTVLDAGYSDLTNLDELFKEKISFLVRVKENTNLYKNILNEHKSTLQCKENFVIYNGRGVYVKCIRTEIVNDNTGYVYLCLDPNKQNSEMTRLAKKAEKSKLKSSKIYELANDSGYFMLASTRRIANTKVLPNYYARQEIEQVFDIGKNYADLLPLSVEKEATFRGHLLLTFIATAVLRKIQQKLLTTSFNTNSLFINLRNHKCKVYENQIVTQELFKKVNDIYKIFNIDCPVTIPVTGISL